MTLATQPRQSGADPVPLKPPEPALRQLLPVGHELEAVGVVKQPLLVAIAALVVLGCHVNRKVGFRGKSSLALGACKPHRDGNLAQRKDGRRLSQVHT